MSEKEKIPGYILGETVFANYEESAKALGLMSMKMQKLENHLLHLLALLVGEKDTTKGYLLGSKLSFKNVCEIVRALTIYNFKIPHRIYLKTICIGFHFWLNAT
jgi:hypothetical protein